LVASVRFWLGFHGCGTSLLYRVPRSRSGARRSGSVRHLLVRVHERAAQCLPVRRRCCQIQLSRSCGLISLLSLMSAPCAAVDEHCGVPASGAVCASAPLPQRLLLRGATTSVVGDHGDHPGVN
jgi:hypothetical protein